LKKTQNNSNSSSKEVNALRFLIQRLCQIIHQSNPELSELARYISEAMLDADNEAIKNSINKVSVIDTKSLAKQNSTDKNIDANLRNISSFVASIVNDLVTPDNLSYLKEKIQASLNRELNENNLKYTLYDTYQIVLKTMNNKTENFNEFLVQLNKNIEDSHIAIQHTKLDRAESMKNSNDLDIKVNKHVKCIENELINSKLGTESIEQINNNMQQLMQALEKFKQNETMRLAMAEKNSKNLELNLKKTTEETKQLQEQLQYERYLAMTDQLTGIPNRAAYHARLEIEMELQKSKKNNLVMAIGDIDNFKQLNDNYGHLAGDKVLVKLANLIVNGLPKNCFAARFGGEEFVLLLPHLELEHAKSIIDTIRKKIAEFPFYFHDKSHHIQVTMSFGISSFEVNTHYEKIFDRADNALYVAKKTKNCISTYF